MPARQAPLAQQVLELFVAVLQRHVDECVDVFIVDAFTAAATFELVIDLPLFSRGH